MEITKELISKYLSYDPDSGFFTWKVYRSRLARPGNVAGSLHSKGYIIIMIEGKYHFAHRLAWILVNNSQPDEVDHINGVRSDNRISNLRNSSRRDNSLNTGLSKRNKSGVKGVSFNRRDNAWQAYASVNGKGFYLGQFKKIDDAISARDNFVAENYNHQFYRES
ncbi:HNH endonuclease [Klebsiella michiganensis]|uniref:HNH endonuclease n=1 Tax=Klebsiella michiganensis TaxID=1134687 RepID=UPI0022500D6F|nr:HNH endonuclease [Klebsiella michiganensis]MCX3078411.1 HNH endonuclease [Klebsiella michiganensis]MCY0817702.1 HNH endonuclease [Klebsiella michiganensis]